MAMTPEQEARYALDYDGKREDLSSEAQVEYDRLKQEAFFATTRQNPYGMPQMVMAQQLAPPVADGKAVASLILGLIPIVPIAGSIVAIVLGNVSQNEARQAGRRPSGLAIAGVVLGWLALAGTILLMILIAVAAAHSSTSSVPCDVTNPSYPNC